MPYITNERRQILSENFDWEPSGTHQMMSSGELNYMFTELVKVYLSDHGLSYTTCNDIVGALENCKNEFQRRVQHPYEDSKIELNGDVYPSRGGSK